MITADYIDLGDDSDIRSLVTPSSLTDYTYAALVVGCEPYLTKLEYTDPSLSFEYALDSVSFTMALSVKKDELECTVPDD